MTLTMRRLGALAEVALGRQRSPEHETGPHMVPYLRAANVKDGHLDLTDVKEMNLSLREQEMFQLLPGDVLVTEGAGSLAAVGAAAVWSGELPGVTCFQNTLLRLRPRTGVDGRYLAWWARHAYADRRFAAEATGVNIYHLGAERVRAIPVPIMGQSRQRGIAAFLDEEIARIDHLLAQKRRLIDLLQERIDSELMAAVGTSGLVRSGGETVATPVSRLLQKLHRTSNDGPMITAFRDGQVTARSLRRAEGYTESWTNTARVQGVVRGDVVVHGLDGFAGAIGTAEVDGVCSPVYHVCTPADGGDPHFYGRLLRLLATTGYLGLFASSTRERAVDFRNWDLFGRIPIPRVDVADQLRIGERIRRLAPLRLAVEKSAELVTERKQALITAAVIGQLDLAREIAEGAP